MPSDHHIQTGGAAGKFPATRPSAITALRSGDAKERERALETIATVYWRPVYTHIRLRWSRESEEASDLAQGFFVEVLERNFFSAFDPQVPLPPFLRVCLAAHATRRRSCHGQKRAAAQNKFP